MINNFFKKHTRFIIAVAMVLGILTCIGNTPALIGLVLFALFLLTAAITEDIINYLGRG